MERTWDDVFKRPSDKSAIPGFPGEVVVVVVVVMMMMMMMMMMVVVVMRRGRRVGNHLIMVMVVGCCRFLGCSEFGSHKS